MLESKSYIVTPPGVMIQEQLDDRGMTQKEFTKRSYRENRHFPFPQRRKSSRP